jgi:hypothetical protein
MHTETHSIKFIKPAKRSLRDKVIESNATALFTSVMTKSMTVRGWAIDTDVTRGTEGTFFTRTDGDGDQYEYVYEMFATITFARDDDKRPGNNELASILRTLAQRANSPAFGNWTLAEANGNAYVIPGDDDDISSNVNADLIGYTDVEIPDDFESYFSHLFGRNSHIARIKKALEAAIMSDWSNRFHCALIGPPGCGKSDICGSLKRALGEDAVMEFDATATTAAGAIKELAERDILPRVMVVEEIEKADEKSLAFLLALCDLRGEIRKTTARATIQRDIKMVVIATVNNVERFESIATGALASRFSNKIGFSRPSREQLAMILTREVKKIGGDPAWIKPTLDYAEERNITDPRLVIAVCLCGMDALVSGEYQKMLADTEME